MEMLLLIAVSVMFFHVGWSARSAKAEKKEDEIYWRASDRAGVHAYYIIYGVESEALSKAISQREQWEAEKWIAKQIQ